MIARVADKHTIEVLDRSQFDVQAILLSGQVFRFEQQDKGFVVMVGGRQAHLFDDGKRVTIESENVDYFWKYFDLDTDYAPIKRSIESFEWMQPLTSVGGGIRILRSEFVEMVISFVISANNNIKRFSKTLKDIASEFGFSLEGLARATEEDFWRLGCGYRSRYLPKTIAQLKEIDESKLATLSNADLQKQLCKISGVGQKVANCIMLFCGDFHRVDIAPVDTWIAKVLATLSEHDKQVLTNHPYAGIAQQYVFYSARQGLMGL